MSGGTDSEEAELALGQRREIQRVGLGRWHVARTGMNREGTSGCIANHRRSAERAGRQAGIHQPAGTYRIESQGLGMCGVAKVSVDVEHELGVMGNESA